MGVERETLDKGGLALNARRLMIGGVWVCAMEALNTCLKNRDRGICLCRHM